MREVGSRKSKNEGEKEGGTKREGRRGGKGSSIVKTQDSKYPRRINRVQIKLGQIFNSLYSACVISQEHKKNDWTRYKEIKRISASREDVEGEENKNKDVTALLMYHVAMIRE